MAGQCARKSDEKYEHGSVPIGDVVEQFEALREDVENGK